MLVVSSDPAPTIRIGSGGVKPVSESAYARLVTPGSYIVLRGGGTTPTQSTIVTNLS